MNLEYKFQVNFPNNNLPKILSRVQNKITEISKSFGTLTLYTKKLKVTKSHIKKRLQYQMSSIKFGSQNLPPLRRKLTT